MSFGGKVTTLPFLHASQADKPSSSYANSAAFKSAMDSTPQALQTALNALIDALNSVTAGSSGAENLASAPISGVTGATVYAQLAYIWSQVQAEAAASGISTTPITGVTGTNVQAMLASLQSNINGVVLGSIPDGSLTGVKLANSTVTGSKIAAYTVDLANLSPNIGRMITQGGMF